MWSGRWFFEPLPESMSLILPVQVLRTDKPLPYGAARAAADVQREKARERHGRRETRLSVGRNDSPEARRRAIELLEANHDFPCDFSVSVIARNDEAVAAAVLAAAAAGSGEPLGEGAHEQHPSAHGKYVSHRLNVPCASAEAVLDLFARLRAVDGVITIL